MLKVSHLSHSFGTHWALKNVSFSLEKGEFLFLSGPSGAGKTTLLRLLHGALPVQRGAASVAGFDLTRLSGRTVPLLRRQVSVVFQDFKILPERSVYANVALPLEVRGLAPQHIGRRVRAVVRALGLENRLDTPGGELSGGEQQRVAVARSIVVNPQVLLADEPTGNLDPELSLRLMDIFMQFHAYGTTVVLATHSPELIRRHSDARLLRLEDGMITHANWPGGEVFRCADGGLHLGDGSGNGMDPCGLDAPGIPGNPGDDGGSASPDSNDSGNPDGRLSL
ncbi:cell division ATP-binding protein FtsE [Desulfovibrio sp. DS-1]|uniref:Cell division ATP-binding protein FtsE n=1 Tax=Nitratidesulfovibrio vulgaris (strain DSM 19637 / Miyazaki F) TaxID=883 RepID=B8DML9_NITV9|nr:cell division ATP-binding protein FtsE [Nitratidesulfovibrio sp. SRB-5]RXF75259.1 cell division ATP-binding protein FtsE [Desulfovibrio sp. DS-1]